MRTTLIALAALAALAPVTTAAPGQRQPGQMTEARVWIENRGHDQAVPVDLRQVNTDAPLRVIVLNGQAAPTISRPVQVTLSPQPWEYRTIAIAAGESQVKALEKPGIDGWETTGVAWVNAEGTNLLLKRPK